MCCLALEEPCLLVCLFDLLMPEYTGFGMMRVQVLSITTGIVPTAHSGTLSMWICEAINWRKFFSFDVDCYAIWLL